MRVGARVRVRIRVRSKVMGATEQCPSPLVTKSDVILRATHQ